MQPRRNAIVRLDLDRRHAGAVLGRLHARREYGRIGEKREALAAPFDDGRPMRFLNVSSAAAMRDAGAIQHFDRLHHAFGAEVHQMIVGEADNIEARNRIGADEIGPRLHHAPGLSGPWRAAISQRPFTIGERDGRTRCVRRQKIEDFRGVGGFGRHIAHEDNARFGAIGHRFLSVCG